MLKFPCEKILQGSGLQYRDIKLFIYAWSREMTSIMKFAQHELGLSSNTTVSP